MVPLRQLSGRFSLATLLIARRFAEPAPLRQRPYKTRRAGFQLFNGKDFTGWKIPNPPSGQFKAVKETKNERWEGGRLRRREKDKEGRTRPGKEITLWQIKDGMIVGGGPASHLFTEMEAEDFHYRVEAKINDKGNSGQYFRTAFGPGFPKGYEAQINATGGDPIKTGSLYPSADKLTSRKDTAC